jgi:hypothetical protein
MIFTFLMKALAARLDILSLAEEGYIGRIDVCVV